MSSKATTRTRFGTIFGRMVTQCPKEIKTYGEGAIGKYGSKDIQSACADEFTKLRKCFDKVKRSLRSK